MKDERVRSLDSCLLKEDFDDLCKRVQENETALKGDRKEHGVLVTAKDAMTLARNNQTAITGIVKLLRGETDDYNDMGLIGEFSQISITMSRIVWLLSILIACVVTLLFESTTGVISNLF